MKTRKVLITGAEGFIGKNLALWLGEIPNFEVLKFVRSDAEHKLESLLNKADCVFHLAGENRPAKPSAFDDVNVGLTKRIVDLLKQSNSQIPVVFSSSVQAQLDNEYGRSKLKAENILRELSEKNKNPVSLYRLPGVFGKWGKPEYNSVVSTFCYNIANNLEVKIDNPDHLINLVYIDDVVKSFVEKIGNEFKGVESPVVEPSYQITLGKLAEQIYNFDRSRENMFVDEVGGGLMRALYATYLSYLPKERFSYNLISHRDQRGAFIEVLKTQTSGQVSVFTAGPGVTRGSHYHHTKNEKFLVLTGKALFSFRNMATDELFEMNTSDAHHTIVDSIPGWAHSIKNVGSSELIVMLWSNEVFDPQNPDTIQAEVSL